MLSFATCAGFLRVLRGSVFGLDKLTTRSLN